jgi:hypothetical protein
MTDERLYRVRMNKGEPSSWKVEHYANIGSSELFVFRFAIEIPRILDASLIQGKEREQVKLGISVFHTEGLVPAFEHLRKIRRHVSETPPLMNRKQAYEDFFRTLWHAYKDLFQSAVRGIGFDIGFLFKSDGEFEKGLQNSNTGSDFADYLRQQRADWQNDLKRVRNDYLEHRKLDWEDVKSFYCVEVAEKFFTGVSITAEEVLIGLIHNRLPPICGIVEIPESERDSNYPLRFQFVLLNAKLPEP